MKKMNLFDYFFPVTRIMVQGARVRVALLNRESGARMGWWRSFPTVEAARVAISRKRAAVRKNRARLSSKS